MHSSNISIARICFTEFILSSALYYKDFTSSLQAAETNWEDKPRQIQLCFHQFYCFGKQTEQGAEWGLCWPVPALWLVLRIFLTILEGYGIDY